MFFKKKVKNVERKGLWYLKYSKMGNKKAANQIRFAALIIYLYD